MTASKHRSTAASCPTARSAADRRRRASRMADAAGRRRRCSRRASTCGSARRRRGCARASCPARISPSPRSCEQLGAARISDSPTARCWRRAASISCRCSRASPSLPTSPRAPIRKARPAGSTSSRASSPTRRAPSTRWPEGYHGPLFLEISPRTFPILVRTGSRLSQIRFRRGNAVLDDAALAKLHAARDAGERQRRASSTGWRSRSTCRATRAASSAIAPSATPA